MVAIHASIYTMLLILTGGLTAWALFFMATGRSVDGAFRSTYILMIVVAVIQGAIGVLMLLDNLRPAQSFHYLYGISLIVFPSFGYALAERTTSSHREALIMGIASAAAFGLILRAAATGGA